MDSPIYRFRRKHKLTLEQFGAKFTPPVNKTTVLRWERKHVPAERVVDVERVTGISRDLLRPDLYEAA